MIKEKTGIQCCHVTFIERKGFKWAVTSENIGYPAFTYSHTQDPKPSSTKTQATGKDSPNGSLDMGRNNNYRQEITTGDGSGGDLFPIIYVMFHGIPRKNQ